jgi:hypothetical protein
MKRGGEKPEIRAAFEELGAKTICIENYHWFAVKKAALFILLSGVLTLAGIAGTLPEVTGLNLSFATVTNETWVQVAMRNGDTHLYAFSCNIGYTNWSFVTGGTTQCVLTNDRPVRYFSAQNISTGGKC